MLHGRNEKGGMVRGSGGRTGTGSHQATPIQLVLQIQMLLQHVVSSRTTRNTAALSTMRGAGSTRKIDLFFEKKST